jgi:predicted nucleic acid-binding protein
MIARLVDSNILIYAYLAEATDARAGLSKTVLVDVARDGGGVLSVQNLTEFSSVCIRKHHTPVSEIKTHLQELFSMFRIVAPSANSVELALSGVEKYQLSFWDAMLWAVAKENGVIEILTEDFQDGQTVDGILYRNPLKTGDV